MELIDLFYYNIPMLFFLGVFSSYQDIKKKIIPNKIIVLTIIYAILGIIIYSILNDDFLFLINMVGRFIILFLIGFLLWNLKVISAGDAKLFIAYGVLLIFPSFDGIILVIGKVGGILKLIVGLFPLMIILLFSFFLAFIFNMIVFMYSTSSLYFKSRDNFNKRIINIKERFKEVFSFLNMAKTISILFILFYILRYVSSLGFDSVLIFNRPIDLSIVQFIIIFFSIIILYLLNKVRREIIFVVSIIAFIISLLSSFEIMFYFIVLIFSFAVLLLKLMISVAEDLYLYHVNYHDIARGMILGEDVVDKNAKKVLYEKGSRLTKDSLNKIRYVLKEENKKNILIQKESSFAIYIFLSVIVFVIVNMIYMS